MILTVEVLVIEYYDYDDNINKYFMKDVINIQDNAVIYCVYYKIIIGDLPFLKNDNNKLSKVIFNTIITSYLLSQICLPHLLHSITLIIYNVDTIFIFLIELK